MRVTTHYDSLGVPRNASAKVIRKAYMALAQKHHPDKNFGNPASTTIMQAINQAYDVLSDPQKKSEYDLSLARQELPVQEPVRTAPQPPSPHRDPPQKKERVPFLVILLSVALVFIVFNYFFYSYNHKQPVISVTALSPPTLSFGGPTVRPVVHKTTTPQELAVCVFAAASTYDVPPSLILGILSVEGGADGQRVLDGGDTSGLGRMQINSSWVPRLARLWGIQEDAAMRMVRDDACINVGVGAWILREAALDKDQHLPKEIALYRAAAHHLSGKTDNDDEAYVGKVIKMMELYKPVRRPEDLIGVEDR